MHVPFKIGADPEIFVGNDQGVRSIIGKIGGTKHAPLPLPLGEGYAVQEDNVALEFNIPACNSRGEFISAIGKATGFLEELMMTNYGLKFDKRSAVSFPEEEMYDPAAFQFGCEPDYNAWTKARNPRPESNDKFLRSCGGHIHIGYEGFDAHDVIKACDLYLGVPSVLMDEGELRKQLYGKAGAFRKTSYGVEYRTLSNYWVFQQALTGWAYDNTARALDAVATGMSFDSDKATILAAIDGNNRDAAASLVEKYNLEVCLS